MAETPEQFLEDAMAYADEAKKPEAPRAGQPTVARSLIGSIAGVGSGKAHRPGRKPPVIMMNTEKPDDYTCLACDDTLGYVETPLPEGEAERVMRMYRRPLCQCETARAEEQQKREALEKYERAKLRCGTALAVAERSLELTPRLSRATFDNYDPDRHPDMKTAYVECRAWAEKAALYYAYKRGSYAVLPDHVKAMQMVPGGPRGGLVLVGPTGRGKSHLTAAMANYLARYGVVCKFWNTAQMFDAMNQEVGGTRAEADIIHAAQNADVLFLDDLGTEHVSAYNPSRVQSAVYDLINTRYEYERPTVVSTMLKPAELATMYGVKGTAIVSRLTSESTWLQLAGPDGRMYQQSTAPALPGRRSG